MHLNRTMLLMEVQLRFEGLTERRRISPFELFMCTDPIMHDLNPVHFPPCPWEADYQARFKALVDDFMLRRGWQLEGRRQELVDALCAEIWELQREWNPFPSSGSWAEVSEKSTAL